jgi:hypothetical protein
MQTIRIDQTNIEKLIATSSIYIQTLPTGKQDIISKDDHTVLSKCSPSYAERPVRLATFEDEEAILNCPQKNLYFKELPVSDATVLSEGLRVF